MIPVNTSALTNDFTESNQRKRFLSKSSLLSASVFEGETFNLYQRWRYFASAKCRFMKLGRKIKDLVMLPWDQEAACARWRHSVWPEGGWSSGSQSSSVWEVLRPRWASHGGFHPASPALHSLQLWFIWILLSKNLSAHSQHHTNINNGFQLMTHQLLSVRIQRSWAAWAAVSPQWWLWSAGPSPWGAVNTSRLHKKPGIIWWSLKTLWKRTSWFSVTQQRFRDTHLEEVSEHEAAGNLDRVDLQGRPAVIDAAVAGAGSHTQHHRLGGAQQLVVHLRTTTWQSSLKQRLLAVLIIQYIHRKQTSSVYVDRDNVVSL